MLEAPCVPPRRTLKRVLFAGKFKPRYTPGITHGIAFSEDKKRTFLGAFDTNTGAVYEITGAPLSCADLAPAPWHPPPG